MISNARSKDKEDGIMCNDLPYITTKRIQRLWRKQKKKCCYCSVDMKTSVNRCTDPEAVTLERIHNVLPRYADNCVLACAKCNRTRGFSYTFDEFTANWKEIKDGAILRCCDCKIIKTADEFHKNKGSTHGINRICKPCTSIRGRNIRKRKRDLLTNN